MARPTDPRIRSRVQLEIEGEVLLAPGRVDLLRAIDETGSITRAAQRIGLSYKAAWDAVEGIGRRAREPVVVRATGGAGGGGTRLTDYGRKLLALVEKLEQPHQGAEAVEPARTALRTSARNHWTGVIRELHVGPIQTDVVVGVDRRHTCVAQITTASAGQLGLARGMRVSALVKAGAVTVRPVTAGRARAQANEARGVIREIHRGEGHAEITIRVSKAYSVVALVRKQRSELAVGREVALSFPPESVLLLVPE
ncbi:MAG: TOBE domain-containing protein [Polyangiales bacterium]